MKRAPRRYPFLVEVNGTIHELATGRRALFFAMEHVNNGAAVTIPPQEGLSKLAQKTRDRMRLSIQHHIDSQYVRWPTREKRRRWMRLLKAKGHKAYPWGGCAIAGVVMTECKLCGWLFNSASSFQNGRVFPDKECPRPLTLRLRGSE